MGFFDFLFPENKYPFESIYLEELSLRDRIEFNSDGFFFYSVFNDKSYELLCLSVADEDDQEKIFKALMKELRRTSSRQKLEAILNRSYKTSDHRFEFMSGRKFFSLVIQLSYRSK